MWGAIPLLHLARRYGLPDDAYGLAEAFARWLGWFIAEHKPTALACEETFADAHPTSALPMGMRLYLGMVALRLGLAFRTVNVATLKKRTTGCGRYPGKAEGKRAMIRYVNLVRPGRNITDHDVADAVALLDMVREDADPRRAFVLRP